MAHRHSVYDSDLHFAINPITRTITNMSSQKTMLIQYDHNSERFTFELPRYVEGHDMSTCNVVEIHYLNIEATTKVQKEGLYRVEDLQLSPEDENVVIGSWLISQNATQLIGSLNFLVRFACVTNGVVDYAWNTAIFSGISVSSGIYNSEIIVEQYADVLQQWYDSIINAGTNGVVLIYKAKDESIAEIEDVTTEKTELLSRFGGTFVSEDEPQEEAVDVWVKDTPEGEEITLLDSTDIVQELSTAEDKIPSVDLLNAIVEKERYYDDPNIEISKESLFTFTELADGTYSIAAKNVWNLNGHIVLPYKYNGKFVTEIAGGGFASHDDNNHITSITGLTIPCTIRAINNTAFARNDIPEIIIPGSCKTIGKTAFYQSKMKKLVLEEGVKKIEANAFTGCSNVTHCVIPSTITYVLPNSFAGAGQVKDVYYGGSQKKFEKEHLIVVTTGTIWDLPLKSLLHDWIWQANVYYNYGNDAEVSKATTENAKAIKANAENISTNAIAIEAIKTAISKGMAIKETILYSGDKFYIHPNSFYIAMPPSKNLAIYYGDGRSNDPYEDQAGIVVGVSSEVNATDNKFRSATIIQTAGSILSSGGTAIYAYFLDNADGIEGGTGAYLKWNGASDTYCPVLHSVSVEIEE